MQVEQPRRHRLQDSPASTGFLFLSLTLYALCLADAAICLNGVDRQVSPVSDCYRGWELLVGIFLGTGDPIVQTWWANLALFFAWLGILTGVRSVSAVLCVVALTIAGAVLLAETTVPVRPAPTVEKVISWSVGYGYWLWLASMVAALPAALLVRPVSNAEGKAPFREREL